MSTTTLSRLAIVGMCWFLAQVSVPGQIVDNFESYADTPALAAAWVDSSGAPVQTLDTTIFHGGLQSMNLAYNVGNSPWFDRVTLSFNTAQDWSGFGALSIWVQGNANNSDENLRVELKDSIGNSLGFALGGGLTKQNDWTEWLVDISSFSRSSVGKIEIGIAPVQYGSGTSLHFDDISLAAPIPEPGTMGMMLLGGVGVVIALRRKLRA